MRRCRGCVAHLLIKPRLEGLHLQVAVDDLEVLFGLVAEVFLELTTLVAVMDELDGLLKANGDEQAEDDGGDVNEEVAPGAGGVVSWVDVEHGCGLLWDGVGCGRGDELLRRDGGGFGHSGGFGHQVYAGSEKVGGKSAGGRKLLPVTSGGFSAS
jgi:hypothetical protein